MEVEFVIAIIIGVLLALSLIAYFVLFFCCNKWIKKGKKPIRVVRFGHKYGKVRLFRMDWEVELRDEEEVFNYKKDVV